MSLKILIISLFVGLSSGALSAGFLHSLEWVAEKRIQNPGIIWLLPIFGVLLAVLLKKIPNHINQGIPFLLNNSMLGPSKISPWMTPFIFLSSLGTHLFGGSAGREGVGVIMGASIGQLLLKINYSFGMFHNHILYAGLAAGFSSIFGTPLAAIVFAFELKRFKDVTRWDYVLCIVLSSSISFFVTHLLGIEHIPLIVSFDFDIQISIYVLIAGVISGVGGNLFYWSLKFYGVFLTKFFSTLVARFIFGSILISVVTYLFDGYKYTGLGADVINSSFSMQMSVKDFFMKYFLTVLTLGVGFKGGEVTPLFFMGATLSNAVLSFFNFTNYALSSALGMVSLFGAVTALPLTSAIIAAELFGWSIGCLAFLSCSLARVFMLNQSVYK